jgi:hypothetical protein
MKQLLLLSSAILISLFSFSQKNSSPGYIIKSNGDSVHGFLQEEIKKDILSQVRFANDKNSQAIAFTPADIKAFGYDGGNIYKRIFFTSVLRDTTLEKICFARQLIYGGYSLYTFLESDKKYFVIKEKDSSYYIYNTIYTNLGSVDEEGNFLETLRLISAPCPQLTSTSDRFAYNEKDMIRFVLDLNQCLEPGKTVVSYYHKPKAVVNIMVFAGGFTTGKENQFTGDLSFRVSYPQINKNASLNIGVHYSNTLTTEDLLNPGNIKYVADTRNEFFSIPITVQYNFTQGIIRPFIYFGISGAMHRETKNKTIYTAESKDSEFGLAGIVAAGVEGHITKNFFINAEWRFEELLQNLSIFQYPAIGVAYKF